ncbi:MAG: hypothetical protein AB2A00_37115 [Myxococcota bacterium]
MRASHFHRPSRHLAFATGVGLLTMLVACPDMLCQDNVFLPPVPQACRTVQVPKKIDVQRAADILFVIDNSGSMSEEQENLRKNASSICDGEPNCANNCDTAQKVADLKEFMLQGEGRGLAPDQWEQQLGAVGKQFKDTLEDCGFIERLLLFDNDFQIGIITTDDGEADIAGGLDRCQAPIPSGRQQPEPQRGCLQGRLGVNESRIIRPTDGDIGLIARKFRETIRNVGVCGSGFEEGLDSVKSFLNPDVEPADTSCEAERSQFLRQAQCLKVDGGTACQLGPDGQPLMGPTPKLVVILLSDEEDCTHHDVDGGINEARLQDSARCYSQPEQLRPVDEFTGYLRSLKPEPGLVSVAAIIAGYNDDTGFVSGDCRCNGEGAGAAPVQSCFAPHGASVSQFECGFQAANNFCGTLPNIENMPPQRPDAGHGQCCTADKGDRYATFARGMEPGSFLLDSICNQNYAETMIRIANLINEAGVVPLGEKPASARQLVVQMKRTPEGEFENVPLAVDAWTRSGPEYLSCTGCPCKSDAGSCPSDVTCDGFSLIDNCTTVKFHGSWVPAAGAEVVVSFLGQNQDEGPKCQQ